MNPGDSVIVLVWDPANHAIVLRPGVVDGTINRRSRAHGDREAVLVEMPSGTIEEHDREAVVDNDPRYGPYLLTDKVVALLKVQQAFTPKAGSAEAEGEDPNAADEDMKLRSVS